MTLNEAFNEDPLDNEIANLALKNLDFNDLDFNDDDAYLLHGLIPGVEQPLDEVISIPERLKRAQRMRRQAKHNAMLRKLKSQRMAPNDRLLSRARKAALLGLRLRIAGKAVKNFNSLSINQKMQIDQQIHRRYGSKLHVTIDRIARKLLPKIQKKEMDRLMKARTVHEGRADSGDEEIPSPGDPLIDPNSTDPLQMDPMMNKPGHHSEFARRKKIRIRRDLAEARKSSYDSEGGNEGDDHIVNQLRKASMARGDHATVKWTDGSSSKLHPHHAKMGLHAYAAMVSRGGPGHMGKDRQNFVKKLGHSEDSFFDSIGLQEDQKYEPKLGGPKDGVKVRKFPKGMQDTAKPFLQLPGKSAQMPYGVGPSIGAISPSNTFGEESLAAMRAGFQKERVPVKMPPIKKAPIVRTRSTSALIRKARAAQPRTSKIARTSGQLSTRHKIRVNADLNYRGNVSESARTNPLGVAQSMLKLATEPRPNETAEQHKIRVAELQARVKKLGGKIEEAIIRKAEKHEMDETILAQVFLRGWEDSLDEEKAFNRLNSFISGGFAVELDSDLAEAQKTTWIPSTTERKGYYRTIQYVPGSTSKKTLSQRKRTKVLDEEHGAGEVGTPELTQAYADMTPGQSINRDDRYMAKLPWEQEDSERELGKSVKTYDDVKKTLAGSLQEGFSSEQAHSMLHAAGFKHASTVTDKKGRETRLYKHPSGKTIHLACGDSNRADYARFHHDNGTSSAATMSGFRKGLESFA